MRTSYPSTLADSADMWDTSTRRFAYADQPHSTRSTCASLPSMSAADIAQAAPEQEGARSTKIEHV